MPRLRAVGDGGEEDGGFLYTVCKIHIIIKYMKEISWLQENRG
jgi:hypothetical protein